jgi:hypothetical protein
VHLDAAQNDQFHNATLTHHACLKACACVFLPCLSQEPELLYIAEEALVAPVPPGWTVHLDAAQNEYFHNAASGESTYEHPMDQHYRQLCQQKRREKHAARGAAAPGIAKAAA